jgi:hypothetical protein
MAPAHAIDPTANTAPPDGSLKIDDVGANLVISVTVQSVDHHLDVLYDRLVVMTVRKGRRDYDGVARRTQLHVITVELISGGAVWGKETRFRLPAPVAVDPLRRNGVGEGP